MTEKQINYQRISLIEYMKKRRRLRLISLLLLLVSAVYVSYRVEFSVLKIYEGVPSMMDLFSRMLSPNISYGDEVIEKLLETIEIAIVSSMLGVMMAIPLSLMTAENISPVPHLSRILNGIFSFFRTIPSLIWAAILVSVFSVGRFPGILALTIIAFLMSLKLFREYIESINENQLNSTKSVGASSIEVLRYCILPNMFGISVSVFFIIFETNIRSATVLGLVGAGGIGQIMWRDLNHLRYDNLATIILVLFFTILAIDLFSLGIRRLLERYSISFKSVNVYRRYKIYKSLAIPLLLVLLIYIVLGNVDLTADRLYLGYTQGSEIVRRLFQVDFSYYQKLIEGIGESFFIAIFATFVGGFFSIILSYFTAYNLSPSRGVSIVFKGIVNVLRTFPPIIMAIIFFRGVGPGPLSGALALSIYTTGVLTKMYSEVLEGLAKNIGDSVLVTGASRLESYRYGIFPQTFGNFVSLLLYRLESNIRNSTILGIIGAGGIGTAIAMNINWRNWERVGLLLLGVSLMIIVIDRLSNYIRKRVS